MDAKSTYLGSEQDSEEDLAKAMDEVGMKLHLAVKHTIKNYPHWHASRIRAASGIRSLDWLLLMTPLFLSPENPMKLAVMGQHGEWTQAMALADNFTDEELKSMSGKQYAYEVFKRANNLLDLKQAQT